MPSDAQVPRGENPEASHQFLTVGFQHFGDEICLGFEGHSSQAEKEHALVREELQAASFVVG